MNMEKLILRYALPGIPLSIIVFLYEKAYDSQGNFMVVNNGFLFILLAVMFGHIIQQIWMYIFDKSGLSYNSDKRLLLKTMIKYYTDKNIEFEKDELYAKWVTWLFSKAPKAIREKNRGNWNIYHTLSANSLGFGIASIISLMIILFNNVQDHRELFIISCIAFSFSSILMYLKSRQTRELIEIQEEYLFKKFRRKILL